MPQVLSDELDAVITRISLPDHAEFAEPAGITGELARLLAWWTRVSEGSAPVVRRVTSIPGLADVASAVEAGAAAADRACDSGATLLIPRAIQQDPVAALSVVGVLTRAEASAITYQGTGMTDREWIERCASVRDASAEASELRSAPLDLLESLGATHIAFVGGALLAASARRTPCLVDGIDELAAALVADRLSFRAKEWWRAGATSPDPGRQAAIERLALETGLPLDLSDDAGAGAEATVALIAMLAEA